MKCYTLIMRNNSLKMLTLNSRNLISMMLYFSWPLMWAWCVFLCYWTLTLSSLFWALICSRSRPALLMQWVRHCHNWHPQKITCTKHRMTANETLSKSFEVNFKWYQLCWPKKFKGKETIWEKKNENSIEEGA